MSSWSASTIIQFAGKKTLKKEVFPIDKPQTLSTTPNNSKENSDEFSSNSAENLLRKIKQNTEEILVETSKTQKDSLNFGKSLSKPIKLENSGFSFNETKQSVNFSNFCPGGSLLKQENSGKTDNVKKEEGGRKDLRHLNKIKNLVDMVGKKYEKMQKK